MFKAIISSLLMMTISNPSPALELSINQEETMKTLPTTGKFPSWLTGVFVRNSSIPIFMDGKQASHLFDGLAMLHGFSFVDGNAFYSNRFLRSKQHDEVVNKGIVPSEGFAGESSFWNKIKDMFSFLFSRNDEGFVNNASVNVYRFGDQFVALTEVPLPACFDLKTLETLGSFDFQDNLPKGNCWESAHPHRDVDTSEIVNFLVEFGWKSHYIFYTMPDESSSREIIAKIPVDRPSYMHSFAMTEHYIVLTEFPLVVNPLDLLIGNKSFIHNFKWEPERGTRFLVIDRRSGKIVSEMKTEAFFSFHHVNAFESVDANEITIDITAYSDISNLTDIFPQASTVEHNSDWDQCFMRYHLILDSHIIQSEKLVEENLEFPRINEKLEGRNYRYAYMNQSDNKKTRGLLKFDMLTRHFITWGSPYEWCSEPVFVEAPGPQKEDEGIVLSVVNPKIGPSFLIALDAETFEEIARAELPWQIPATFHGQYFTEYVK